MKPFVHLVVREKSPLVFSLDVYDIDTEFNPKTIISSQPFDDFQNAMKFAKSVYPDMYKVLSLYHLKLDEPHPFHFSVKPLEPTHHDYRLPLGFFEVYVHEWFRLRKQYQPLFSIQTYHQMNESSRQNISLRLNYDSTDDTSQKSLLEEYGENADYLPFILEEMFHTKDFSYSFSFDEQLVLISIPVQQNKTSIFPPMPQALAKLLHS